MCDEEIHITTSVRTTRGEANLSIWITLHQSSILSLYLFNLVLDVLTKDTQKLIPKCNYFAYDIVLIEESRARSALNLSFRERLWDQRFSQLLE